jgi:hypothetical protein
MSKLKLYILGIFGLVLLTGTVSAIPDVSIPMSTLTDVNVTGGNEPHDAVVNPLNPQNVVVAKCALSISSDFGKTFPKVVGIGIPPGFSSGGRGCDDVVSFDAKGRLWWTYLLFDTNPRPNNLHVIVQEVNTTSGQPVGPAIDVSGNGHNDDKPWIAADSNPASPFANNVYVHWTRLDNNPTDEMFSRCVDCANTNTFSAPASIAGGEGEGFRHQSHVTTGPEGNVYVSYHTNTCDNFGQPTAGDIVLMRDPSGGANLSAGGNPPAGVKKINVFGPGGADVTCNRQDSGKNEPTVPKAHFLMQGSSAPFVVADPIRPGNIYVIANDDPDNAAGSGDDGDIVMARSTDYGQTFTVSKIDHAPQGADSLQVFPQGVADQDGNLVVFWYDTRRHINNNGPDRIAGTADDYWNLDVYATVSRDGGQTFTDDFRINDVPFDPELDAPDYGCPSACDNPKTDRIGEYNGLAAANGNAYVAWTGNTQTGQEILFDVFSMLGAFPDRFEPNDAINPGVPTDLGSAPFYSQQGLTIHSLTDEDFFKVVAYATGTMTFQVQFNSRISDLDVQIQDQFGNPIANEPTSGLDNRDVEKLTIPVVKGQTYYMRIFAKPSQISPFNTYGFTITNTPAPIPFEIKLDPASDSGRSNSDDVTNVKTPTINFRLDDSDLIANGIQFSTDLTTPGYKVLVYDNGVTIGFANNLGNGNYQFTFPSTIPMTEGINSITSKVSIVDPDTTNGLGGESNSLAVTLDTIAPAAPSTPDLEDSSDNAGISDDDVTTIQTPKFAGTGEPNALIRIFANGALVGQSLMNTNGAFEATVIPLADGVYNINAKLEDLAGNVGAASGSLKVTIAHDSLNLPGATSGLANGPVVLDLAAGTISGFPGIAGATGKIGIVGIPTINFDVNNNQLTILGTPGDDNLNYKPTDTQKGTLTVGKTGQVLNFASVGQLVVDPLAGNDKVTTLGTLNGDNIKADVNTNTKISINNLLPITMPIANVESLQIPADNGVDTINVTSHNTVNASLFVDGGLPTNNPPNGDSLIIGDGSGGAKFSKQPGGPVPNSGSVVVTYPNNVQTRIDYTSIEKLSIQH